MKKSFLFKLLISILTLCSCLTFMIGCEVSDIDGILGDIKDYPSSGTEHYCIYDKQVAESDYLATEATCTLKATYYLSCECGEKGTETFESGEFAAHTYTQEVAEAGYLATEATCTAKATYYKSCTCGAVGAESFESGGLAAHVYQVVVTDPTCTVGGYTTYTCQRTGCDHTYTADEVGASGHDFHQVVMEDRYLANIPSCVVLAQYYYSCKCGEAGTETFDGEEIKHMYIHEGVSDAYLATSATCTAASTYYKSCECGKSSKDDTNAIFTFGEALGHDYDEDVTDPTCTAGGYTTYTCQRVGCVHGYVANEVVALGHTSGEEVVENELAPKCDEDGSYDQVVYCTVCTEQVSRKTIVVDALGHDYSSEVTQPTCTNPGYTTYTCSVCDDTYESDRVAATGHSYTVEIVSDDTLKSKATCTVSAVYYKTCSGCGAVSTDDNDTFTVTQTVAHNYVSNKCTWCGCEFDFVAARVGEDANTVFFFNRSEGTAQITCDDVVFDAEKGMTKVSVSTGGVAKTIEIPISVKEYNITSTDYLYMQVYYEGTATAIPIRTNGGSTPCYGMTIRSGEYATMLMPLSVLQKGMFKIVDYTVEGSIWFGVGKAVPADYAKSLFDTNLEYTVGNTDFVGYQYMAKYRSNSTTEFKPSTVGAKRLTCGTGYWADNQNIHNQLSDIVPHYIDGSIRLYVDKKKHDGKVIGTPRLVLKFAEAKSGFNADSSYVLITVRGDVVTGIHLTTDSVDTSLGYDVNTVEVVETLPNGYKTYKVTGFGVAGDPSDINFEYLAIDFASIDNAYYQVAISNIQVVI